MNKSVHIKILKATIPIIVALTLFAHNLSSQTTITMPASGTRTDTLHAGISYTLLDPGGAGNYPNSCNSRLTILSDSGTAISISGLVRTEYDNDFLFVYEGTNTNSSMLAAYSGLQNADITAATGVLTLVFTSNSYSTFNGFALNISVCDIPLGEATGITVDTVTPNSASISWESNNSPSNWTVFYGIVPNDLTSSVTSSTTAATISGLESNTTYFYTISNGSLVGNPCSHRIHKFSTTCDEIRGSCIDYSNLSSCYVKGTYGSFTDPCINIGIVDSGSNSSLSRHTVHHDTAETDPRTDNLLHTIPPGYNSSIRLGNWEVGGEAESITYEYMVDTTACDLLLLKYAAVLQVPNHSASEQPHFSFMFLDEDGNEINSSCYSANFIASTDLGWNICHDQRSGPVQSDLLWKDWTTVGIDLSPLHGETIFIRLTTSDCSHLHHFGYAYFVLGCSTKKLTAETCGPLAENTFTAPNGFSYQWFKASQPDSILSTSESLHVTLAGEYRCQLSFVGAPAGANCSFELAAIADARFPAAIMSWDSLSREGCDLAVALHNGSLISRDTSHLILTSSPCDNVDWFVDSVWLSSEDNPTALLTPGLHTVQIVASLAGGSCTDTASQTIFVGNPCYRNDTIMATICEGDTAWFFNSPLTQTGIYDEDSGYHHRTLILTVNPTHDTTILDTIVENQLPYSWNDISFDGDTVNCRLSTVNHLGCDSTIHYSLHIWHNIFLELDSTVCDNQLPLQWHGHLFTLPSDSSHSGISTLNFQLSTLNSHGADSTVYLHLTVLPTHDISLHDTICDNEFPYTWSGHTFENKNSSLSSHLTTINTYGCDSIVHLYLTVHPTNDTSVYDTIVENQLPYSWNSILFDGETVNYQLSTVNHHGCDSIINYSLHVWLNSHEVRDSSVCDNQLPLLWHGHLFTLPSDTSHSGISTLNSQLSTLNSHGADSTVQLRLTVYPTYDISLFDTICDNRLPYSWNGHTFAGDSTSFNFQLSTLNYYGCDSTVHLHLTVSPTYDTSLYDTICDNQLPYTWHSHTFENGGSTVQQFNNIYGCDSSISLNLTVFRTYHIYDRAVVCEGVPYRWIDGNTYSSSTYDPKIFYSDIHGCDSVLHLLLDIDDNFKASMEIAPEVVDIDHPEVRLRDRSESHSRQWFAGSSNLDYIDSSRISMFTFPMDEDSLQVLLVARTMAGCTDSVWGVVHSDRSLLWVPNAFTPDEQQNNSFYIISNQLATCEMWIYNRQGLLITHFDALTGSWDGTYRGYPCPQGTYTWVLKYTSLLQPHQLRTAKGTVTLLR